MSGEFGVGCVHRVGVKRASFPDRDGRAKKDAPASSCRIDFYIATTTTQNIPGDGTYAPILAWYSTGSPNLAAGPVVVTTGKYMVAFASQYEVGTTVTFAASGANNAGQLSIQIVLKRGTNTYVIAQDTKQPSANSAIPTVLYAQTLGNFIAGDEIWVQSAQTSTVALPLAVGVATKFHVQPRNGASTA